METQPLEPVYSIDGLSKVLGCHPTAIRKWIKAGKIRTISLGRLVRIPGEEAARIIDEGFTLKDA